jgi:UDP-GlcNAc:undecaprenyl-phosphate GlcNAc-1-phosphate transferase
MQLLHPLNIIFTFVIALSVTILVLPRISHIASKIGLIDFPDRRKVHRDPKPLIGGVGMMIGISISLLLFIPLSNLRGFYAGLLLLSIVGFLDDFKELGPRWKFSAQILASIFMIYFSKTILYSFGNLLAFGPINFGILAVPMTIFCTVGVINAINMIDGVDGLAGGISLVGFISFAILSHINNQIKLMLLSIAFSGALIAFLRYNWYPSKMFMGDAGSFSLGFTLTFLSISIVQKENSIVPPVTILCVLAVPIVDTLTVMTKRAMQGKSPFHADRAHLHHILMRFGVDKKSTTELLILLSAIFSLFGVLGTAFRIPEYYMFLVFSAYFITYFVASFYIKDMFRFFRRRQPRKLSS